MKLVYLKLGESAPECGEVPGHSVACFPDIDTFRIESTSSMLRTGHTTMRLPRQEALKMWTIWAAKSMGQADVKGSIEPGKFADLTVLSDDIFTMPKEGLKDVKVLKTIVGGAVVYEAN